MSNCIDLFINDYYMSYGILKWVSWDMERAPHLLLCGQTGSGKTYMAKLLLAKTYLATKCELYIADYKSDSDFDWLCNLPHFYRYTQCHNALEDFYVRFTQRQNGVDKQRHPIVFFFDEWASYCNASDKKILEEDKKKLGILVSLGRSFRCHIIISQQRCDAVYFGTFRDNFSGMMVGNGSEESRKMLFPDYAKNIPADRTRGTGYVSFNGCKPIAFTVPSIRRPFYVHRLIKEAVSTRSNS